MRFCLPRCSVIGKNILDKNMRKGEDSHGKHLFGSTLGQPVAPQASRARTQQRCCPLPHASPVPVATTLPGRGRQVRGGAVLSPPQAAGRSGEGPAPASAGKGGMHPDHTLIHHLDGPWACSYTEIRVATLKLIINEQ